MLFVEMVHSLHGGGIHRAERRWLRTGGAAVKHKGYWAWMILLLLLLGAGISLLITGIQMERERPLLPTPRVQVLAGNGEDGIDAAS